MRVIALIALVLIGCGKQEVQTTEAPLDPNRCPTEYYGLSQDEVRFYSDGRFAIELNTAPSSGTYTCDAATKTLTITIDSYQEPSWAAYYEGGLEEGTYTCSYNYTTGSSYDYLDFSLTCNGDNALNPTVVFPTTRWE